MRIVLEAVLSLSITGVHAVMSLACASRTQKNPFAGFFLATAQAS
jgi:hypothetical protein